MADLKGYSAFIELATNTRHGERGFILPHEASATAIKLVAGPHPHLISVELSRSDVDHLLDLLRDNREPFDKMSEERRGRLADVLDRSRDMLWKARDVEVAAEAARGRTVGAPPLRGMMM